MLVSWFYFKFALLRPVIVFSYTGLPSCSGLMGQRCFWYSSTSRVATLFNEIYYSCAYRCKPQHSSTFFYFTSTPTVVTVINDLPAINLAKELVYKDRVDQFSQGTDRHKAYKAGAGRDGYSEERDNNFTTNRELGHPTVTVKKNSFCQACLNG